MDTREMTRTPSANQAYAQTDGRKWRQTFFAQAEKDGWNDNGNNVDYITTLYSTYEYREKLDSLSLFITVRNRPNKVCNAASKLQKEI